MGDLSSFIAALDRLRQENGLSFRQLEANARAQGAWLPRATANDAVNRSQLPAQQPVEFIAAWARACGADPEPWLAAWRALAGEPPRDEGRVPRQLPADIDGFTGRDHHMAQLDQLLDDAREARVVALITGTAGVGKTALAVHWARRAAGRFPDGQLYIDLRGFAHDPPVEPEQALSLFLQALGVPNGEIPMDLDAQVGLYRSLLSARRMLLILDNAADVRQVRPLLPGSDRSSVVVTSRHRLTGLIAREGARSIEVTRLCADESSSLLAYVIGSDRALREPQALADIARLCAHLPLALRVSAANLAAQPHLNLADYVHLLDGGDPLGALEVLGDDESAVRAAFHLSYSRLTPSAQRLFRLLGSVPVVDFTLPAANALAGEPSAALLAELTVAHLLDPFPGGRYGMHDLLRRYATECTQTDDQPLAVQAATEQLWMWYSAQVAHASAVVSPNSPYRGLPEPWPDTKPSVLLDDVPAALAWLSAEYANLVAIAKYVAEHGPRSLAWHLAGCLLGGIVFVRRNMVELVALVESSLHAGLLENYPPAQAIAHHLLGNAHWWVADYQAANSHFGQAKELYNAIKDARMVAAMLNNLALATMESGDLNTAEAQATAALDCEGLPDYHVVLFTATYAKVLCTLQRYDEARVAAELGCRLAAEVDDSRAQAEMLLAHGMALRGLGEHAHALSALEEACSRAREVDYLRGLAHSQAEIAEIHFACGQDEQARSQAEEAFPLARETSHRLIEGQILLLRARLYLREDQVAQAVEAATQAVNLHQRFQQRVCQARALATLAKIHHQRGDEDSAHACAEEAEQLLAAAGVLS